jgi:cyanophycin synthetase
LDNAPDGGLVVIFPESVTRAIDLIKARNPLPEVAIDAIEPKPGRKRRQAAATERSNSNNGKKPQTVETAIIS